MKRLHYLNLLGVLALAGLCLLQWQANRRLNLEINRLRQTQFDDSAKLAEQEKTGRGLNSDLTQFKEQFTRARTESDELHRKFTAAERDGRQLAIERDQLRSSVTNWAAAVAARDQRLQQAREQINHLTEDLNASIRKFNELATNHNALVKELDAVRSRAAQSPPSPPPAP